jgi:hypothetical protein
MAKLKLKLQFQIARSHHALMPNTVGLAHVFRKRLMAEVMRNRCLKGRSLLLRL